MTVLVTDPSAFFFPAEAKAAAAASLPRSSKSDPPLSDKTSKANTSEASKCARVCLTHGSKKIVPDPLS